MSIELNKDNLSVDTESLDCSDGRGIGLNLDTWFNVAEKFELHLKEDEGLILAAAYDPFEDTLTMGYDVGDVNESKQFEYRPTETEAQAVKELIAETIREQFGLTPQEFCWENGLPEYLQHDLDSYKAGVKNDSRQIASLWLDLNGSIYAAEKGDGAISSEHADYLRMKYLAAGDHELQRTELKVDSDIQIADDGRSLTVYLETWFDAGKKFGVDLSAEDAWLNMYATYGPFADTLEMAYTVETDTFSSTNKYFPTDNEARLVKAMIREHIRNEYGQTPQEFCQEAIKDNDMEMGGQT